MSHPTTLNVEGLEVKFGAFTAVGGASFNAQPGDVHFLIGPNGAGKTTCVDAITGLVKVTGRVKLGEDEVLEASRTTAAHSTLVVDDTSSARFAASAGLGHWLGDEMLGGPAVVTAERGEDETGLRVALAHDGYVARFGLTHRRTLVLARDGSRLDGHDRLEATAKSSDVSRPRYARFRRLQSGM